MRISDWSSDVCPSDLGGICMWIGHEYSEAATHGLRGTCVNLAEPEPRARLADSIMGDDAGLLRMRPAAEQHQSTDRKSVVEGKRVSGRVGFGGRRTLEKHTTHK